MIHLALNKMQQWFQPNSTRSGRGPQDETSHLPQDQFQFSGTLPQTSGEVQADATKTAFRVDGTNYHGQPVRDEKTGNLQYHMMSGKDVITVMDEQSFHSFYHQLPPSSRS